MLLAKIQSLENWRFPFAEDTDSDISNTRYSPRFRKSMSKIAVGKWRA